MGTHGKDTDTTALNIVVKEGRGVFSGAFAFHFNRDVSEVSTHHLSLTLENLTDRMNEFTEHVRQLVTDLLYLDAVRAVDIERDSVTVYCGEAFTFEDINERIVDRMLEHLEWTGSVTLRHKIGLFS